jgi:hypothetical protein
MPKLTEKIEGILQPLWEDKKSPNAETVAQLLTLFQAHDTEMLAKIEGKSVEGTIMEHRNIQPIIRTEPIEIPKTEKWIKLDDIKSLYGALDE